MTGPEQTAAERMLDRWASLLDAIARSDGSRRSIARELFATRVHDDLLGSFAIDQQGDTTARDVTIYRVDHGSLELWRVIEPSAELMSH